MTGSSNLRSRIDGYCVRSVSEDDSHLEIVAEYDGVESHLSIGDVFRDEAVEVALCGLRLDYVRREIGRGTATAADVRVAIEDAAVLGHGDDDVSDLIEAFMLLASDGELDAWRSEKIKRLADEMDEAEAAHRANPRPVLVDFTRIDLGCEEADLSGLPESADILVRLPATNAFISYGRGRLTKSDASIAIAMSEPLPNEHRPLIRDGILDVMIRANVPNVPNLVIVLENALFRSSPTKGTVSIERSIPTDSFELIVADLLPDDDDGGEEPGAMYRRAFAKAKERVDLVRQVATMICRQGDLNIIVADEATRRRFLDRAREIIELVRSTPAPDTITLTRDKLTSALREAAAQGMDRTSGPSCEEAASCRDVADEIIEAIDAGRFSADDYGYRVESERRAVS